MQLPRGRKKVDNDLIERPTRHIWLCQRCCLSLGKKDRWGKVEVWSN